MYIIIPLCTFIFQFIYNECSEKVELDTISSHHCFTGEEDVYLSGRYIMKTGMFINFFFIILSVPKINN